MDIVEPLVRDAISVAIMRNDTPVMLLDDTGLVYQFASTAHICRRSQQVDSFKWDNIGERVLDFSRSIRARFEEHHGNWSDKDLYIECDELHAPDFDSDVESSNGGYFIKKMANNVAFL